MQLCPVLMVFCSGTLSDAVAFARLGSFPSVHSLALIKVRYFALRAADPCDEGENAGAENWHVRAATAPHVVQLTVGQVS